MKGQAEIIIVLGIIIIAAVVVVFTTQREAIFPPSSEVAVLRASLENEIEQNLYSKALESIDLVGSQGGYTEPPEELSISYQGSQVPYWQYAGQSLAPEIDVVENNIANAIKAYANQISLSEYQGKSVSMGAASSVEVTIAQDSVNIRVWQPVTLEGYQLSQPFEFSVTTGLGRAYDLAKQVTTKNIEGRYLDHFTVASLFMYGALDGTGSPKVPSFGVLTQCGQVLYKNWFDVKDEVESLLKGSLARTYMAGQTPDNVLENSQFPVHVFPVKTSTPVAFRLGEPLASSSFQFNPNPVTAHAEVVPLSAICMSAPYLVHYWMLYPIVAEVRESGYTFRFALQAYIDDNKAGDWGQAGVYMAEWREQMDKCEFTRCSAGITVTDSDGPIPNADVMFSGCNLGRTDRSGRLDAGIPCGLGLLEVYRDQKHEVYREYISDDDMGSKMVHMFKKPLLRFNIFNIEFTNSSGTGRVRNITRNTNQNMTMAVATPSDTVFLSTEEGAIVTQSIPSGLANIGTYLMEGNNIVGGFLIDYVVTEEDKTLNLYIPTLEGGIDNIDAIYSLQDILDSCGVFAISEEELDTAEVIASCEGSI